MAIIELNVPVARNASAITPVATSETTGVPRALTCVANERPSPSRLTEYNTRDASRGHGLRALGSDATTTRRTSSSLRLLNSALATVAAAGGEPARALVGSTTTNAMLMSR